MDASAPSLTTARDVLNGAGRIVVLTGAGMSTDSGIPDFRGPNGVWTRNPEAEKAATISHYLADDELRRLAWQRRLDNPAWHAEPNAGHRALAGLEAQGRLALLVTQNIDGLHVAAGSDPANVVEVHGTIAEAVCVTCRWRAPMAEVLDRVRAGDPDPRCPVDGGIIKSATVYFGESLDPDDLERAFASVEDCDCLLAVGTSLQVRPIANMVPRALAEGVPVVIVNGEPTPFDQKAAAVVHDSISDVLPDLLAP